MATGKQLALVVLLHIRTYILEWQTKLSVEVISSSKTRSETVFLDDWMKRGLINVDSLFFISMEDSILSLISIFQKTALLNNYFRFIYQISINRFAHYLASRTTCCLIVCLIRNRLVVQSFKEPVSSCVQSFNEPVSSCVQSFKEPVSLQWCLRCYLFGCWCDDAQLYTN